MVEVREHIRLGALEHVLIAFVRVVSVRFKETDVNLLNGLTPLQHTALELGKRVRPDTRLEGHIADTVYKSIDELVHERLGRIKRRNSLGNVALRCRRNTHLILIRRINANRIENLRIGRIERPYGFFCHFSS